MIQNFEITFILCGKLKFYKKSARRSIYTLQFSFLPLDVSRFSLFIVDETNFYQKVIYVTLCFYLKITWQVKLVGRTFCYVIWLQVFERLGNWRESNINSDLVNIKLLWIRRYKMFEMNLNLFWIFSKKHRSYILWILLNQKIITETEWIFFWKMGSEVSGGYLANLSYYIGTTEPALKLLLTVLAGKVMLLLGYKYITVIIEIVFTFIKWKIYETHFVLNILFHCNVIIILLLKNEYLNIGQIFKIFIML